MKNSLKIFAILILAALVIAFTESKTVTGTVTDSHGQPIPGVSITVKGTAKGAISDSNGKYKISVEQWENILVFSFIGYQTIEEKDWRPDSH